MRTTALCVLATLLLSLCAELALAANVGDKVEVIRSGEWVPGTIARVIRDKYQVRLEGGGLIVTTEAGIRVVGGAALPGNASGADADAGAAEAAAPDSGGDASDKRVFQPNQKVEIKQSTLWEAGVVKQRAGDLYLVARDSFKDQFFWMWVDVDRLREPGSDHEGPDAFDQFRTSAIGNEHPLKALAGIKKEYETYVRKAARRAASAAINGGDPDDNDRFGPPPFDKPVTEVNYRNIRDVVVQMVPGGWQLAPDTAADAKPSSPAALKGGSGGRAERLDRIIVGKNAAMIVYKDPFERDALDMSVELVSLGSGNSSAMTFDAASLPMAISDNGTLVAGRSNGFHSGSKYRADIWRVQGDTFTHVVSFAPNETRDAFNDIDEMQFVGDDLLVIQAGAFVTAWEPTTAKPLWRVTSRGSKTLTANGKYLAVIEGTTLMFVEVATGKVTASLGGMPRDAGSISISPGGTRMAMRGTNSIYFWDLENGKRMPSIGLPPGVNFGALNFADEENLLLGKTLFNINARTPVWSYEGSNVAQLQSANGLHWGILNAGRNVLCNWNLPHNEIKRSLASIEPAASLLVPGESVSLDLAGLECSDQQREQIAASIRQNLANRNIRIDAGAPVRIVGVTQDGQAQQRTYESRGGFPSERQKTTVNYTEKITRLYIEADGKIAWEVAAVGGPSSFVSVKEGQSAEQAILASAGANAAFLQMIDLPDVVIMPKDDYIRGASTLVAGGVSK